MLTLLTRFVVYRPSYSSLSMQYFKDDHEHFDKQPTANNNGFSSWGAALQRSPAGRWMKQWEKPKKKCLIEVWPNVLCRQPWGILSYCSTQRHIVGGVGCTSIIFYSCHLAVSPHTLIYLENLFCSICLWGVTAVFSLMYIWKGWSSKNGIKVGWYHIQLYTVVCSMFLPAKTRTAHFT